VSLNHSEIFSLFSECLNVFIHCWFKLCHYFNLSQLVVAAFIIEHFDEHNISLSYLNYYCSTPFETSVQWDFLCYEVLRKAVSCTLGVYMHFNIALSTLQCSLYTQSYPHVIQMFCERTAVNATRSSVASADAEWKECSSGKILSAFLE
jgi:hypothetical protein